MVPTITRLLEFDAGHRVLGHESKCARLHGHRYRAEITAQAMGLDSLGRVIDFSVLKKIVGSWIDENWDHNMLLHQDDPLTLIYSSPKIIVPALAPDAEDKVVSRGSLFAGKPPFIFPPGQNPTAENIASYLLVKAQELIQPYGISVKAVRIYETPNCFADAVALLRTSHGRESTAS